MYNNGQFITPWDPFFNNTPIQNNSTQQAPNNTMQGKIDLIKVDGLQGAKAYQIPPDSAVAMFDKNEDIMYVKTTDSAGFYKNILAFSISPIQLDTDNSQFVTRKEFNELKEVIETYGKQIIGNYSNTGSQRNNEQK